MKNLGINILLIFLIFTASGQEAKRKSRKALKAEKTEQQREEIKAIVESKTFIFDVSTVNPMIGQTIQLTSNYEVKITGDSIFSYLPFFGVAYSANYGGTESPMIFTKPFETCTQEKTKNGYLVKVSVKNENDRLDYSFHISETGMVNLVVSSVNRQTITYNGNLKKITEYGKETK